MRPREGAAAASHAPLALAALAAVWSCTSLELPGGPFPAGAGGEGGAVATRGAGGQGGAGGEGGAGGPPLPPIALVTDDATSLAGLAVTSEHLFWLVADAGLQRMTRGAPSTSELWQTGNGPVHSASRLSRRGDRLFWLRRPDEADCDAVVEEVTLGGLSFGHAFADCFTEVRLTVGEQRIVAAIDTANPEKLREATVGAATSFGESVVSLAISDPAAAHADAQGGVLVSGSSNACTDCTFRVAGMTVSPLSSQLAASLIDSSPTHVYLARGEQLWRAPYQGAEPELFAEVGAAIVALEVGPAGQPYLGLVEGGTGTVIQIGDGGEIIRVAESLGEPRYLASDDASLFIGDPPRDSIWRVDLE